MSLCRYFPVPSDRMGILWTVLPVKDCVVIEYGPAGTTHYGTETVGDLGISVNKNLFCTHVDENDIIMGDISRLEKAILEVDAMYGPKCIFVIGSSLTAVIAADIAGLCRMLSPRVNSRLIAFEHGGFRGDYSLGIRDGLTAMVENITASGSARAGGTFNLIGACYDGYRIGSDVSAICRMMRDCFHMEPGCILPYETTYDKIKSCTAAEFSIVMRQEAIPAAKLIREKGGGPWMYGLPYGYQGTLNWIKAVAGVSGRKPDGAYMAGLYERIGGAGVKEKQLRFAMMKHRAVVEGPETLVSGLGGFLKEELGFEVAGIAGHSLRNHENVPDWVRFYEEKEKLELLKNAGDQLILGSDVTLAQAPAGNVKLRVAHPALDFIGVANHLPFVGLDGADFLMESILSYHNERVLTLMMQ